MHFVGGMGGMCRRVLQEAPLFQVILTRLSAGCFTRPGKGGKQNGCQDANNPKNGS